MIADVIAKWAEIGQWYIEFILLNCREGGCVVMKLCEEMINVPIDEVKWEAVLLKKAYQIRYLVVDRDPCRTRDVCSMEEGMD